MLAAETIEREVFPGLKLNGIIDVNFKGFIRVVDTLGCAYVNVDHRYYNANVGSAETNYTSINLQPGYQKLCYENALYYVRYRHTDSDFVRVARQQDFLRDLREQVSPGNELGQIDTVAKAVGHAISSTFHASASELIELAKLIAFSQSKPLRQVKFLTRERQLPDQRRLLRDHHAGARDGDARTTSCTATQPERASPTPPAPSSHHSPSRLEPQRVRRGATLDLYPTHGGESEVVKAALSVPFRVLYPTLQTGQAEQQTVRAYALDDQQGHPHHAYVVVWQQNTIGGYYDFEGTDWLNPPLFAHARTEKIGGRTYLLVDDGSHIHVIGWRSGSVLYWVTNTLLEELSNAADARDRQLGADAALSAAAAPARRCRRICPTPSRGPVERGVDERVGARVLGARARCGSTSCRSRAAPPSPRGAAAASPRA